MSKAIRIWNLANVALLEKTLYGMVGVWKQRTGHPVIIIVEMVATQNTVTPETSGVKERDMEFVGCIWGPEIMK